MTRWLLRAGASVRADLPPCYANRPLDGLRSQLDRKLLRWTDDVDGILLAYDGLILQQRKARLDPIHAYARVFGHARVLVFRPREGDLLRGKVTRLGRKKINLSVLGLFPAVVSSGGVEKQPSARKKSASEKGTIELGEKVEFVVDRVDVRDGRCMLEGTVISVLREDNGTMLDLGKEGALNRAVPRIDLDETMERKGAEKHRSKEGSEGEPKKRRRRDSIQGDEGTSKRQSRERR